MILGSAYDVAISARDEVVLPSWSVVKEQLPLVILGHAYVAMESRFLTVPRRVLLDLSRSVSGVDMLPFLGLAIPS